MDNNPNSNSISPVPGGVWIPREEYNMLKEQSAALSSGIAPQAVQSSPQSVPENVNVSTTQVMTGGLLAIGLLVALTSDGFSFMAIPLLMVFVIYAWVSIAGFIKANRANAQTSQSSSIFGQKSRLIKTLLILAIILLAVPVIGPAIIFVLFMILLGFSGGDVGS